MLFNGKSLVVVLIILNKSVGARAHQQLGWPHFVSGHGFEYCGAIPKGIEYASSFC